MTIAFDPTLVRNRRTSGLRGRYTAAAGLDQLLRGAGLRAVSDGAGGFTLATLPSASARPVRRAEPQPARPAAAPQDAASACSSARFPSTPPRPGP
ncbi:STN domain-containing protein [Phenylobacterium sp. LjRoot219]|uniref:STN domain-containing protein n=1 Tax=Phenylobacterium sp. LjRoot219 TaxID=3342283 RepID=UPI003F507964